MRPFSFKTMVLGLMCCCGFAVASAQNNTGTTPAFQPAKATGNAQTDAANYSSSKEAWYNAQTTNVTATEVKKEVVVDPALTITTEAEKNAWIESHSAEYGATVTKTTITKADLANMSAEKQRDILARPDLFEVK